MFDILFSLDGGPRGVMLFKIDKRFNAIFFRKTWNGSFLVLVRAADQIVGDADVKRASGTACEYICPERHDF